MSEAGIGPEDLGGGYGFDDLLALERAGFIELEVNGDEAAISLPGFVGFDGFPEGEVEEQVRDTLACVCGSCSAVSHSMPRSRSGR